MDDKVEISRQEYERLKTVQQLLADETFREKLIQLMQATSPPGSASRENEHWDDQESVWDHV